MYMLYHISLSVSRYTSLLLRPSLSPSLSLSLLFVFLSFFLSFSPSLSLSMQYVHADLDYMDIYI